MKRIVLGVLVLAAAACWAGETAGRPKILGIAYVKVRVTDLEKAKGFYGEVLGLASGSVRDGNFVQADQCVELTRGGRRGRANRIWWRLDWQPVTRRKCGRI